MPETDNVLLYRAVSWAEFDEVTRTGVFSVRESTVEGKYFAESFDAAVAWGAAFQSLEGFRILVVEFDASTVDEMLHWPRLDGIGPARFAPLEVANKARTIQEARP